MRNVGTIIMSNPHIDTVERNVGAIMPATQNKCNKCKAYGSGGIKGIEKD
jgi:hypothetical protein